MQGQRVSYPKSLHMAGNSCKYLDLHTTVSARCPGPMPGPRDRAESSASEKSSGIFTRVDVPLSGGLGGIPWLGLFSDKPAMAEKLIRQRQFLYKICQLP